MTVSEAHTEATRESFSQQAPTFEDARFNRVLTTDSDWLFTALPLGGDEIVLDVAAGTGLAARALARSVRVVLAIDATAAMLDVGRRHAAQEGLSNIVFQHGDAAALPFLDQSFDIVACRYALHHFETPASQLQEMTRCLRAGGYLALADLVSDRDPATAAHHNMLERLRDPSHARALPLTELSAAVTNAGAEIVNVETRAVRRPLGPWMEQTATPQNAAAAIEAALLAELNGSGPATGFDPRGDEPSSLTIVQNLTSIIARRNV